MKITYDPEADVLCIILSSAVPSDSVEIESGTYYEVDDTGHLVSIEILDASEKYQGYNVVDYKQYPVHFVKRVKKHPITS